MEYYRRVYTEINLDAIKHNIIEIQKLLKGKSKVMPIIKADGYGHGAVPIAKFLQEEDIDKFGVATIEEAVALRKNNIHKPLLVLGYTPNNQVIDLVKYDLIQTVFKYSMAEAISKMAKECNKNVKIHLKIDTGMGRIGFLPNKESIELIKNIYNLPNIEIEGIFTHFSKADEVDKTYTKHQLSVFNKFVRDLEEVGVCIPIKHAANSAGIIDVEEAHFDLVRLGIATYGLYPSDDVNKRIISLKPALSLISHIIYIKEVEKGTYISYGGTYKTKDRAKIATIPVGYGDGYDRGLSSKGRVLIRGQYAPIVGRVCMDQFMVDVTNIKGVADDDEVVLIGKQGEKNITVDEIASLIGTINYEVVCQLGKRIPRVYKQNSKCIYTVDYF